MDIYTQKTRWKFYLALAGLLIIIISLVYTNYLASKLADEERNKVELWVKAQEMLNDGDSEDFDNCDFTLHYELIASNKTIPVLLASEAGKVNAARNFGEENDTNAVFLEQQLAEMKAEGYEPIKGFAQNIYYKNSTLLTLLKYFPLLQFILIVSFIALGYVGFSSARRSEQNLVWVGMAKETAHQLGTPITAIIGWIEHLKMMNEDDKMTQDVLVELRNDVVRLELIADRFSKIGSSPTLEKINIYEELEKCRAYMQRRASRKVKFDFPKVENSEEVIVNINPPLFDWVIENLLRNALDAMDGTGEISAIVYEEKDFVVMDIMDTGKGIPSSKHKTVFQPGFTTKKRGWGLGLSLAKRIIESYHSGKIFVKESIVNEGTTFTIKLPKG